MVRYIPQEWISPGEPIRRGELIMHPQNLGFIYWLDWTGELESVPSRKSSRLDDLNTKYGIYTYPPYRKKEYSVGTVLFDILSNRLIQLGYQELLILNIVAEACEFYFHTLNRQIRTNQIAGYTVNYHQSSSSSLISTAIRVDLDMNSPSHQITRP